jgi:hypothetical protein
MYSFVSLGFNACFELGTDEKAIIDVLARCSNEQRQKTKALFKTMYGKVSDTVLY